MVDGVDAELIGLAQAYLERRGARGVDGPDSIAATPRWSLDWDEVYCRRVADHFDRAPLFACDSALSRLYDRFKRENLQQYQVVLDAGIAVEPWLRPGQPYRGSAELRAAVRNTGVLHVYLTSSGHGTEPAPREHPMLAPSGVEAGGVPFTHNDVFRAVHDIFGHVMFGHDFSPRGEFRAAFTHLRMYPGAVHPVLFTEHLAQICWFFFGPHAGERRYPPQKVVRLPGSLLAAYRGLFRFDGHGHFNKVW
jgi:hypothetical protein